MASKLKFLRNLFTHATLQEGADRDFTGEGKRKKHIVKIGDTEYLNKNVQVKKSKRHDKVNIGQRIPSKRLFGEGRKNANFLSMREVFVARMLEMLSYDDAGGKLFHVPSMTIHQSQLDGFDNSSFTILSKIAGEFRLLREDIHDLRSGRPINYADKHSPKHYTAMLNNGTVSGGKEVQNLEYGAIIPLLFADYDQPGTKGQNLGTVMSDQGDESLMLSFFDLGQSFGKNEMTKNDVSSDLMMHNGIIGKKEQNFHPLRDRWYQRIVTQNLIDCSLVDRMRAFEHALSIYLSDGGNGNSPSEKLQLLFEAFKEQIWGASIDVPHKEKQDYIKRMQASMDAFVNRLVHIRDNVLKHRRGKEDAYLNMIDQVRLIASPSTPTNMSKAGYVLRESPITVEVIGERIELGAKSSSEAKEAAKRLSYALNYLYNKTSEHEFSFTEENGKYYFELQPIKLAQLKLNIQQKEVPFNLFENPYDSKRGANALACALARKDALVNIAKQLPTNPVDFNVETIKLLASLIGEQLADIGEKATIFGLSQNNDFRFKYQFMNTPLITIGQQEYSLMDYIAIHQQSIENQAKKERLAGPAKQLLSAYKFFDDQLAVNLYKHHKRPEYVDLRVASQGNAGKWLKAKILPASLRAKTIVGEHSKALVTTGETKAEEAPALVI